MIAYEDILSLNYYNYGRAFTGSYQGMRYRIIKQKSVKDDAGNVTQAEGLLVHIWHEPFSFVKTEEEQKISQLFSFDEEGKKKAVDWLNLSWKEGEWQK